MVNSRTSQTHSSNLAALQTLHSKKARHQKHMFARMFACSVYTSQQESKTSKTHVCKNVRMFGVYKNLCKNFWNIIWVWRLQDAQEIYFRESFCASLKPMKLPLHLHICIQIYHSILKKTLCLSLSHSSSTSGTGSILRSFEVSASLELCIFSLL